jgi:hypothetical protein
MNPGPNLKICYQNVRGLIPFSELGKPQPSLDVGKIFELNAYINVNRPDVVILNETWLNKSIKDDDLIYNNTYSIFRNDRLPLLHCTGEVVGYIYIYIYIYPITILANKSAPPYSHELPACQHPTQP